MNAQIRRLLIHLALALATIFSLGAIVWVVVDSWVMPRVARAGWPVVVIPDVSGLSAEQASEKLSAIGLDPQIDPERRRADHIGPDLVAQQRPAPGDSVKKGHAVRLWLSAGASTVPVPDLQGQDSADALTHIQEASFQVGGIDYSPSHWIPSGHVLHTDPTSGSLLTRGSSIRLTISSGADPDSVSDSVPTAPTKPAPRTF